VGRLVVLVEGHAGILAHAARPGAAAGFPGRALRRLASKLIAGALDDARERGLAVLPFCPFVNAYIERHREYAALVPANYREHFGL